jgi:hypothetical protein
MLLILSTSSLTLMVVNVVSYPTPIGVSSSGDEEAEA